MAHVVMQTMVLPPRLERRARDWESSAEPVFAKGHRLLWRLIDPFL